MIKKIFNGIKSIFISLTCALLGALGGADGYSKAWRRIGIPFVIAGLAWSYLHHWLIFSIFSMIAVLSLGYGVPDSSDSGSHLGRFFYWIFRGNHFLTDIFTRGTIGFLICLTLLSIPLIKSNWIVYIIGSLIIKNVYIWLSWRDLGGFYFNGKRMIWSEAITYGTVGLIASLMVIL